MYKFIEVNRRVGIVGRKCARTSAHSNPYTYYIMNETQKMKTKLRNSKAWKGMRKRFKKDQKIDPITLKPLTNRFNLHHRDLDETHYCILSNDDHFVALNPTSHDLVHFLYNIVKREQSYDVLDRIKVELQKMAEINLLRTKSIKEENRK